MCDSDDDSEYVEDIKGIIWRKSTNDDSTEKYKIVLPESLRKEVLETYHNSLMAGHGGVRKTYNRVKEQFYWPNMIADVKKHCSECHICAMKKLQRRSEHH